MSFTNTWHGAGTGATAGDYSDPRNWVLISVRTAAFTWTASGSGTGEFYLRRVGNIDPGFITTPNTTYGVVVNGSNFTYSASLGSLAASRWGFGDNDSLGYDTLYVRLSDDADPDSKAVDFVQFRQIPSATESVRIPAGSNSITSGLDQSSVEITGFYVEEGYDGTIGSASSYLRIRPDLVHINSRGQSFIDVGAEAIPITIESTGTADQGEYGANIRGTAITLVDARGGSIGIAALPGEIAAVTTLRMSNQNTTVKCGAGVTLTSAIPIFDGNLWLHCNATTITKYGGNVWLREAAAVTTVNNLGGEFHWGSSGNIGTYNARGGTFNMRASNASRTLSTLNRYFRFGSIIRNKTAVTITTETPQDDFTDNGSD
jgi:hypothetical protein